MSPKCSTIASASIVVSSTTYCAQLSMSRARTRVSRPAQRPTALSTPSAAITTRARISPRPLVPNRRSRSSDRRPAHRDGFRRPFVSRHRPSIACCGDRRLECRAIEDVTDVTLGDADLTSVGRAKHDPRNSPRDPRSERVPLGRGSRNSETPADPTPSPQRTGVPTRSSRSSRLIESVRSPRAASRAATSPAGPPPMMRTSQSSTCTCLHRGG